MTRIMGDAVTVTNLPLGLALYAGYINGVNTSTNFAELEARFPRAHLLTITTDGNLGANADICDCEAGDYNPSTAAEWARLRLAAGIRPTIYANRGTWPAVVTQLGARAITVGQVDWWCPTLDDHTQIVQGAVAVQWTDHGGQWDETIVHDDNWHPSPPSPQSPKPPKGAILMAEGAPFVVEGPGAHAVVWPNGYKTGIGSAQAVTALMSQFGQANVVQLDQDTFNAIPTLPAQP